MRRQKDIKIAEVWMQSGFTNETSFFRTFKLVTGLTPNEWKSNDQN
jgi:YesN/AraC family two-component response regulator